MPREIKLNEVKKHSNKKSAWVIIHNDVYDLTKFLDEHPGGADAILAYAGNDGTQAFEDVGHSQDARELMKKFKIGSLSDDHCNTEPCKPKVKKKSRSPSPPLQLNRDIVVLQQNNDCCREPKKESSKTWRTFDGTRDRRSGSPKADSRSANPVVEPHCQTIIVPHERRARGLPCARPGSGGSGGKLKWALLALAGAIIIGIVMKKYMKG